MTSSVINVFMSGGICVGYAVASLLFLRFWRRTNDRLFAWFAAAFAVLMVERLLWFWSEIAHTYAVVYMARLVGFLLIIGAVIDRNRRLHR